MARPRKYPYDATIRSEHLTFSAGASCLDFANTRELRKGAEPQEFLHRYDDLMVFAQRVDLLRPSEFRTLRRSAAKSRRRATTVFNEAIRLREAIYAIVAACAGGGSPPTDAMALINDQRRAAASDSEVVYHGGRFEPRWHLGSSGLHAITWPIVESFTTLLADENRVQLLRECQGVDCGWLFLDGSRTRRRRWCRMSACGNRAKASRHYAKWL